jgi:phosphocarrier protein
VAALSETVLEITNAVGLHARPAAQFVKTANRFRARITLDLAGRTADAKSILSVLGLQAGRGTSVAVRAEGEDADAAVAALRDLVESNFGEAA